MFKKKIQDAAKVIQILLFLIYKSTVTFFKR